MANEKRLIVVNDALEVLCNYCDVEGCCPPGKCAEYQKISNLPTVDAVEVVRCKDCEKGYKRTSNSKLDFVWCGKWQNIMRSCDFCSFGERKDNERKAD